MWTPELRDGHSSGMESNDIDVYRVPTTSAPPGADGPREVRIKYGFRAWISNAHADLPRWEIWEAIALARIAAVNGSLESTPTFVGSSALLLHGITGWVKNPDVTIHIDARRRTTWLPEVLFGDVRIPPVRVSCRRSRPLTGEPSLHGSGFLVESPQDALLRVVMGDEQLPAFVLACMAMRAWAPFNAADQEGAREKEALIKARLAEILDARAPGRGTRRGSRILRAADASCENPAEAALLWVVLTVSPLPVVTQHEIRLGGRTYYADIAVVDLKIIFEFDGLAKLGSSKAEIEAEKRRWVLRDEALRDDGWKVIRVCWADFEDFHTLRQRIRRAFSSTRSLSPPPCAPLWAVPSKDCDGPDRRIHSSAPVSADTRRKAPQHRGGGSPQSSSTGGIDRGTHAAERRTPAVGLTQRTRTLLVDPDPPDWTE